MIKIVLLTLLAAFKFKFKRNESTFQYLQRTYDHATIVSYRSLEATTRKLVKANLDLKFLYTCKLNNVTPNFVKFKLYRSSLYNSEFYHDSVIKLIDMEICHKEKLSRKFRSLATHIQAALYSKLSLLDTLFISSQLSKYLSVFSDKISNTHERKLHKFGVSQPNFKFLDNAVFNFSSYTLSAKEKFLLSLGLDFCLPTSKPRYVHYFSVFEKLAYSLLPLSDEKTFNSFRRDCSHLAHKFYSGHWGKNWLPFLNSDDLKILKTLGKNVQLVITKPDKGNGVVVMDRSVYIDKINSLLNDHSKFELIDCPDRFRLIYKIEDKINRFLSTLKNNGTLSRDSYEDLYVSGSSFGILYGSPKVHKGPSVPLRPILAAYNLPSYKLAKFLVPLLSHLTSNSHSIHNSSNFCNFITKQDPNNFLVSYDVEALFTNVPVQETISIILDKLYETQDSLYCGLKKSEFSTLLNLAVNDIHFIFNDKLFKQKDGMAMGSPLGPTFANIFMSHLENKFLQDCDPSFKPSFYKRYVDDTIVGFQNISQAHQFLKYINSSHANIKFTMDIEKENTMNFLDVSIHRSGTSFSTNVFRKASHTGLGLNFYSFCPYIYKLNSCKTLLHRAYNNCSNWLNFSEEASKLEKYFLDNNFPAHLFPKQLKIFLDSILRPKLPVISVPKCTKYISFPYLGSKSKQLQRELLQIISNHYTFIDLKIVFSNSFKIGSFFHFKDSLQSLMRSGVVYLYNCPKCDMGRYVGCTIRLLQVRICGHMGVSYRTLSDISTKEHSSVRNHSFSCKSELQFSDFKILHSSSSKQSLLIAESLLIKQLAPNLNSDQSSSPLYIT